MQQDIIALESNYVTDRRCQPQYERLSSGVKNNLFNWGHLINHHVLDTLWYLQYVNGDLSHVMT